MLLLQKIYTYFTEKYAPKVSSKGWYVFKCPFCNDLSKTTKCAIHYGYQHVKCWKCGYSDSAIRFVEDVEDMSYIEARDYILSLQEGELALTHLSDLEYTGKDIEITGMVLPDGFTPLRDAVGIYGKRCKHYLKSRQLSIPYLDSKNFGYVSLVSSGLKPELNFSGYLIVPFYRNGNLCYYLGRDFMGNFLRYKNPPAEIVSAGKEMFLFNHDALYLYEEVCLLEGWSDAVTLGDDAISTQGWKISATQEALILDSPVSSIVRIPDICEEKNKDPRHYILKAYEESIKYLDTKQVKVVELTEVLQHNPTLQGKDVNAIGGEIVREYIDIAEALDYDKIIQKLIA